MTKPVQVAGVQLDVRLSEKESNIAKMESMLQDSRLTDAVLVVFPECAVTGYCYESKEHAMTVAEPIPGPSSERLQALARRHDKHLAFGTLERSGEELFNTCVLMSPAGLTGIYRKSHLPFLGVDRFTTPGLQPPPVFDLGSIRVGLHICYDASFPETTRTLMLASADLAILPTNWPQDAIRFAEHLAPVRSFENNIYFMIVNRVGSEGGFQFIGRSTICDPLGQTLVEGSGTDEDILIGTLYPDLARQKRIVREPGRHSIDRLADRRPDLYGKLVERLT